MKLLNLAIATVILMLGAATSAQTTGSTSYKVVSMDGGFCIYHNLYSVALGQVGSVLQVTMDASGVTFTDPSTSFSNIDSYPVGSASEPIMDDSGNLIFTGSYVSANVYEQNVKGQKGNDPGDAYVVRVTRSGSDLTYESGNGSGTINHTCLLSLTN